MAVKCHYFGLLMVVGLIAIFPSTSDALFEPCVDDTNCTDTGSYCRTGDSVCVCIEATHYQITGSNNCTAKVAVNEVCISNIDQQAPCLDQNAACQSDGTDYRCTCNTGFSANGGQCVQVLDCPDLNDPTNGVVQTSIDADSGNATYTCNQGYVINGSNNQSTIRICENSLWADPEPTCSVLECDDVTDLNNGVVVITNNTEGGIATYTCNEGYVVVGANNQQVATRQCSNGAWSNEAPTCSPIDCGSTISTITNGQATVENSQSTVNSTATVECNNGYQTSTNAVTCQADGNWSSAICALIDCGPTINTITNGQASVVDQITVNSSATVLCNTGYETSTNTVICQADGNWSPATCTLKDCGSNIDTITNGQATVVDQSTVNSTATVQCNTGYETSTNTVTCQADGNWSAATCTLIDCGSTISTITNGQATVENSQSTVNSTATVQCNTGYEITVNTVVTCQANGNWSSATCTIKDCGTTINTITNGQANLTVVDQTIVNSTATVECNIGYNTSTTTVTCQANGNWSSAICTIKDCGDPDTAVTNGGATPSGGQTTYESTATVNCNQGYESDTSQITCTADGTWSTAECTQQNCGTLQDGNTFTVTTTSTTEGGIATYTCNTGYTIGTSTDTTSTRTCTSGSWTGTEPNCTPVDCGSLDNPMNGTVSSQDSVYNTVVTFTCNNGYTITAGDSSRTCQANGTWSGTQPTCSKRDCGQLNNPVSGTVVTNPDNKLGSTATYTCNAGYIITAGDGTRTCQADGSWSGTQPTCSKRDCGSVSSPNNGGVTTNPDTKYGATATYTCNSGYVISGTDRTTSKTLTCTASGSWSESAPTCSRIDCGQLNNPVSGTVVTNPDNKLGSTATYTCNAGYIITAGDGTRTCQADGSWSGTQPTCSKRDCGSVSSPNNGGVTTNPDTKYGATATYTCNSGYVITGTARTTSKTLTCTASGSWSENAPTCSRIDCYALQNPQNGQVITAAGTTYESTATYTCNTGFIISGSVSDISRIVTCTATGAWSETVTCSAKADPLGATCPNPTTTVLTAGQLCSGDNAFCLQRTSDSQDYTCQCGSTYYDDNGNNDAGQCRPVAELAVQDITFQAVTTSSMRVTWSPPSNKENFVFGYTVEWRPKGSNNVISTSQVLSSTFFDITSGVTPGSAYTVTVTSRNQVDYSDVIKTTSSQKEQALKPATPGPIITSSSDFDVENDNTIDLVWTPSTGTVYMYEVRLYEAGSQRAALAGISSFNPSANLTYPQIKNGHKYDVTIIALSQQFDGTNVVRSETHREEIKTVVKEPSPPRSVECLMTTDNSVTIKWQTPTTPNGDLIQYRVDTYQLNNPTLLKAENTGDLDLTFEVTGLDPGSYYFFNVFTINEQFTSAATRLTEQFCQTKARMADAPNSLQVTNIESRNVTFSWTRPTNTYGEHLGYIVQIRLLDETCVKQLVISCTGCTETFNVNSLENMCDQSFSMTEQLTKQDINSDTLLSRTFMGLDPDMYYNVIVTAVNTEGRGRIANQTLQTQEEVPQKPKSVTITDLTATSCTVTWDIDGPRPGDTTYTVIVNPVTPVIYNDATVRGFTNRTSVLSSLQEYWNYNVTIRATTSKGSTDSDPITFQTLPAAPGIVNNFSITPHPNDDYRKMEVQWKLPELLERNGVIDSFVLQHNTTQDMDNQMMTFNKNADDSFSYVQVFNVTPEVLYTFKVYAVNTENQNGTEKEKTVMAPAGVPRNDFEETDQRAVINESLATSSQTTLRLAFGTDFFTQDRNGDITLSGVIICAQSKCPNNEVGTSLSKAQFETYPSWYVAQSDGFSRYRCTRPEWRQQANNGRRRRQVQTTEEFTIGAESCNETTQNEFCNGPLSPGTSYVVHVVICTNGGCLISNEYGPFVTQQVPRPPDDDDQVIIIVAVIVPVVVIIIAVIVVVFILKRRRKPSMSRMTETKMEANFEDTTTSMIKKKRPVKLSEFEDHLIKLHKDSNLLFSAEYDDLRTIAPSHPQEAANREENRLKNRYINILPFDHSRVKLFSNGEEDSSDYINGNYLPGINSPREYIGCQGPIPGTIDDFWRMVWEQKVSIVVMLTLCKEGQKVKCEQYWPDEQGEPKQYGDVVVEVTSTSTIQTYIMRIFKITNAGETRTIKHFHFLSWLDFQANVKHDIILDFITHVRSHVQPPDTKGPMIVHCSAGVGRTGTYICLDHLMQFIEEHDFEVNIDIFDMVLNLRNNRPLMVQTEQQYVFIHDCVKELMDRKRKQMENIYENQGFSTTDENIYQNTEPQLYENVQMKTPL